MSRPGLRERKKIATLHRMQEEALRLFGEQGYEATTIEQIAEAAGVSPSTFYRYFPTKEDVVIQDEYDPLIVAAFQSQPEGASPLEALRLAVAELLAQFTPQDLERAKGRLDLILSVPALRARQLQQGLATEKMLAEHVASRVGRSADDLEVRNLAAAVIASWSAAVLAWAEGGCKDDLSDFLDRCLSHLERGLPL